MKTYRLLALPFTLGIAVALSAASKNPSPKIDVNIVGEVFPATPAYTAPTPTAPAYYVLHDAGYVEIGDPVGGDKTPAPQEITRALARYLPSSNFLPATTGHSPSLLLVTHWGALRDDTNEISPPFEIRQSLRARIRLVSTPEIAQRIERDLTDRLYRGNARLNFAWPRTLSNLEQDTLDIARDDHYFVVVTAYDYQAATQKKIVPVWRLKLSTYDRRTSMPDALPALIRHGRAYFGQSTAEPINERMPLHPDTEVKVRDLQILGEVPPAPAASEIPAETLKALQSSESSEISGVKTKPVETDKPVIPTALHQRLEDYRAKKLALQNELKAQLAQAAPGADPARLVETFNRQHADRIAALNREQEAIRSELARLAAAHPTAGDGKSIQALLNEFATANY